MELEFLIYGCGEKTAGGMILRLFNSVRTHVLLNILLVVKVEQITTAILSVHVVCDIGALKSKGR